MDRASERKQEIDAAVADVRAIEAKQGVDPGSLEAIKRRLTRLAERDDLFRAADFPPPAPDGKLKSCLYRVAEDADHRFALYVNSSLGGHSSPAHNHTTWAVIVGIAGEELNRLYDRGADGGVREKGRFVVRRGTGVAFMPEDLHSIHIEGPVLNFHMYGLALEHLPRRQFYKEAERAWRVYGAHPDIREARLGGA